MASADFPVRSKAGVEWPTLRIWWQFRQMKLRVLQKA